MIEWDDKGGWRLASRIDDAPVRLYAAPVDEREFFIPANNLARVRMRERGDR